MRWKNNNAKRAGAIIPLVALSLIAIMGLVALAIDIGMVAVAKTQAQNAADVASLVGVRTFTQQSGYNLANVPINAVTAATQNKIFNTAITGNPSSITNPSTDTYVSGAVTIQCGGYYYVYNDSNPSSEAFQLVIPGKSASEPYTAVRATINTTSPVFFGAVFGANPFNVKATAVAAHRPRDVVIVMDLSGSMRFQSVVGAYKSGSYMYPNYGPRTVSLNPDDAFPTWGHYTDSTTAALKGTTAGTTGVELVDPSNHSTTWSVAGPPCLADFMSSGSTPAFTRDSSKDSYATTPGGDNYLKSGTSYSIKTVTDSIGTSTPTPTQKLDWERAQNSAGYAGVTFKGYSEGPGYWGKTMFIWPPHPQGSDLDASDYANHADNGALDWRQRFFFKEKTSDNSLYWLDHNNILFNPSGAPCTSDWSWGTPIMKTPQTTTSVTENGSSVSYRYRINYAAVFKWLSSSPVHFPSAMTTGRIKYYSKIPDHTDTALNTRMWTQNPITDLSERFWKDYVDYMFGLCHSGANTYTNADNRGNSFTSMIGSGDMYAWGTVQIGQKADCNYTATINQSGGYAKGYSGAMNFNNVKTLSGTATDLPGPNAITNATNASPIVITSPNHGLSTNNIISITGVTGNTAANNSSTNKTWTVTVVDSNTFKLNGSTGNGSFTSTGVGAWVPAITAATNASPVVITTGANHNLSTGMVVNVSGVTGNTGANGKWEVTVLSSTQFKLINSSGNGSYSSSSTQWWEPAYYVRFGNGSTIYELNPATITSGTLQATPDIALKAALANSSSVKIYTNVPAYMSYTDNPYRPRHQFWFGPQTFGDWLANYSVYQYPNGIYTLRWPGNVHEAQAWACKVGISSAIDDIKNNHPNDFVGLTFFSSPSYSTSGGGQHNMAVIPLGRNYQGLKDSLWFPPSTVSGGVTSITPYDADFDNVPRAKGGTGPQMGLMIAYNLLSSSATNLRSYATPTTTYRGYAGGLGRKGAARLVIFETDGAPNTRAYSSLSGSGSDSYYQIRIKDPQSISNSQNQFPSSGTYTNSEVYDVVKQICAMTTDSPPGYSTSRKPALVYGIGYGSMFDPANSTTSGQSGALSFLQTLQYYGGVASDTTGTNFPDWQRIYGDNATRQTRLQTALTNIMQAGVQVSLLE